ncbi:MAG: ribonuclease P protein component [Proteobacteria bacterium]|nr:ribonuclease P protein component [Pseudomonadota bacterium]
MRDTIKKHSDFISGDDDVSPKFICEFFIARSRPTKFANDARYGITASKRTFRHAVDRNRAKRLLRVWIRMNESALCPDLDYTFIARSNILNARLPDGVAFMKRALKKLSHTTNSMKTE